MQATQAVGIDLGTTYSCIAALNEHGEPYSISNPEGELSTPSVVFFDHGEEIVGVEALRNVVAKPDRVVQNAKRFMGDPKKRWLIGGKSYSPTDISAIILRQLLTNAEKELGKITQAVITVPAQFNDFQRAATVEAGKKAGLKQIDIINEPVAAALCYVLGTEGIWFTELANDQTILVYDLGGGTFDLSLVKYRQDEVRVLASTGDLHLGGIDWNQALLDDIADRFAKDFNSDPRDDPESLQYLYWEVEQTKRSLTVRPKTSINVQHAGQRKSYNVEQSRFNELTSPLVLRTEEITKRLLKDNNLGWAKVDVVLMTGGSSRMPMIREMLKKLSGRTINTSLSPDQSIAHGATYYAGMLISKSEFVNSILSSDVTARLKKVQQKSVTARGLGILIRDTRTNTRVPHYLIQPNTPLPASVTQIFGTVIENQKRVHLHIVESGARSELPHVNLGNCTIEDLPPNLKRDSEIAVTISYDESARVHVSAKEVSSGKAASVELVRTENLVTQDLSEDEPDDVRIELGNEQVPNAAERTIVQKAKPMMNTKPSVKPIEPNRPAVSSGPVKGATFHDLDSADIPIALCNKCGEPLNARGVCTECAQAPKRPAPRPAAPTATSTTAIIGKSSGAAPSKPAVAKPASGAVKPAPAAGSPKPVPVAKSVPVPKPVVKPTPGAAVPGKQPPPSKPKPPQFMDDDDVIDLFGSSDNIEIEKPAPAPKPRPQPPAKPAAKPAPKPNPPAGSSKPTVRPMPPPKRPLGPPLDD